MNNRAEIEAAIRRKAGAEPAQKEAIAATWAKQDDWYGTCRKCREKLRGRVADIKAHVCKVP